MTLTDGGGTAVAERLTGPRRAGRPRPALLVTILVFGIPLAVIAGWWALSASLTGGTSLWFDAQPVRCEGAEVTVRPSADDPDLMQTTVEVQPGMQCFVRVHVANDSWFDVSIDSVVLPFMGTDSGLGVEAQFVNPNAQERDDREDGAGRFPMPGGLPVAAGGDELLEIAVTNRGRAENSGCVSASVTIPLVEVSVWGYHRTVEPPDQPKIWWLEGTVAECDSEPEP